MSTSICARTRSHKRQTNTIKAAGRDGYYGGRLRWEALTSISADGKRQVCRRSRSCTTPIYFQTAMWNDLDAILNRLRFYRWCCCPVVMVWAHNITRRGLMANKHDHRGIEENPELSGAREPLVLARFTISSAATFRVCTHTHTRQRTFARAPLRLLYHVVDGCDASSPRLVPLGFMKDVRKNMWPSRKLSRSGVNWYAWSSEKARDRHRERDETVWKLITI